MTQNPHTPQQIRDAIKQSGLVHAYTSFNSNKVMARIRKGGDGFIEDYEGLVSVRDAEEKFYRLMGAKDYDRTQSNSAAKVRAKYRPMLEEYVRPTLPFSYAVVDFARQIIKETLPPEGKVDLLGYMQEQVDGCKYQDEQEFFQKVYAHLGRIAKDDVSGLKITPENVVALQADKLAQTLEIEDPVERDYEAKRLAFEIFVHAGHEKTPEDMNRLVKLWPGKGKHRGAQNDLSEEPSLEADKPENFWKNRYVQGGLGVALMVAPALIPPEKSDKLTFGKVLRTTAAILLPIAGIVLLSRAMSSGDFQSRLNDEAHSRGAGFNR